MKPTFLLLNGQGALKKPETFRENMCIETWLEKLESFLRPFDKRTWADIASTYLSESCYKKIKKLRELKKKEGGFLELKRQLSELHVPKR